MRTAHDLLRQFGSVLAPEDVELTDQPEAHTPSFADYLTSIGIDPDRTLDERVRAARAESTPDATVREQLASAGLTNSGYAAFLSDSARQREEAALHEAERAYQSTKRTAADGYLDYLADTAKEELSLTERLFSYAEALRADVTDERLLRYAERIGLRGERAEQAVADTREHLLALAREKASTAVLRYDLTAAEARAYARSLGLDEAAVEQIAAFAQSLRDAILNGTDEIRDAYH